MYWLYADAHFGHAKILDHCSRPFDTIEEHDLTLIGNWNDRVAPNDHVYILGDFCWRRPEYALWLLHTLKGRKYLIRGNHDKAVRGECLKQLELDVKYHELTIQDKNVKGGKQTIVLCHYPLETWLRSHWKQTWHLHGHTHGRLKTSKFNRIDVGVDVTNYCPISYEEVKERIKEHNDRL